MLAIRTRVTINKEKLLENGITPFLQDPYIGGTPYGDICEYYDVTMRDVLSDFGFDVSTHYDAETQTNIVREYDRAIVMDVWDDWYGIEREDLSQEIKDKIADRMNEFPIFNACTEVDTGMPEAVFANQMAGITHMLQNLGASESEVAKIGQETIDFAQAMGWK